MRLNKIRWNGMKLNLIKLNWIKLNLIVFNWTPVRQAAMRCWWRITYARACNTSPQPAERSPSITGLRHTTFWCSKRSCGRRWGGSLEKGRGNATAREDVHQDRGQDDGGAAHQTPEGMPPEHDQSRHIPGTYTGACPCGHHQWQGDGGSRKTLRRGRSREDGISEPPLLDHGFWSGELRLIVADFTKWLSNGRPPWAAYRAMMSGWLIEPGVRPVGVGETWRRLIAKCLLQVTG